MSPVSSRSSGTDGSKLTVLLLSEINETRQASLAPGATAAKALGAFCLQTYVLAQPDLRDRVDIEIRSVPRDIPMNRLLGLVLERHPDVLGLTCQVWNHEDHARLSALVRKALPHTMVVHGGPMVVRRRRYLERLGAAILHVAVEGYGEETFADLLRSRLDGAPRLEEIPGIAYFSAEGEPRVTVDRTDPDLASMPSVITAENLETLGSYALYETARGCPYSCKFCNWGTHRIQYRDRSVIERDLAALLGHPGVETLWIVDSAIDIRRSHARFLADVIRRHRQHPVRVVGYVFLKARDLSFVQDLVGAFDTLQLGLQTADPHSLGELGRGGLQVERFDAMFDAVLPHFPGLRVDLMYGLPGLRLTELQASVRALLQRSIRFLNIFRLVSIPGTEMGERREDYGILAEDWAPYEVYSAAGVSTDEMFRMLRFKEAMDVLRPVLATGCYADALRGGVDLVDFASYLPAASPALMEAISFQDEHDAVLPPSTVGLVQEAAVRYTAGSEQRRDLLGRLLREGYASVSREPAPAQPPTHPPNAARSPQRRSRRARAAVTIPLCVDGGSWWVRAERASRGTRYFGVVGDVGLYYGWDGETRPPGEELVQQRMSGLLARLRTAQVSAADLSGGGGRLRALMQEDPAE